MLSLRKALLRLLQLYLCWLAFLAVHESGHMLAAISCGGHVRRLEFPLLGFSRTDIDPDPHPLITVWAGPLIGFLAPILPLLILRVLHKQPTPLYRFFAGLCAVANGAYIGAGVFMPVGDARIMRMLGSPPWLLSAFGLIALATGLWQWHVLTRPSSPKSA